MEINKCSVVVSVSKLVTLLDTVDKMVSFETPPSFSEYSCTCCGNEMSNGIISFDFVVMFSIAAIVTSDIEVLECDGIGVVGISGIAIGVVGISDVDIGIIGISCVAFGVVGISGVAFGVVGISGVAIGVVGISVNNVPLSNGVVLLPG